MQAIILAAGMGKRLGDLTHENTKCMIKVHGRTLIERMLDQLSQLNLSRVILVIGYKGDKLKALVGDSYNGLRIEYVENPIYDKTNNIYSLYLAKEFLLEEDTLLLESDLIFDDRILTRLLNDSYPNLAVVAKYQSWMDGTVVSLDAENNIINFVPKKNFQFEDIDIYFKTVNIYKFSRAFSHSHYVPFLEAYSKALGNNEYYEQVLRVITLLEKPDIKAMRLDKEAWYEIDDIQDLNNAETIFADKNNKLPAYQSRFGGYWRYPGLLDFCYLVNPFFPPARLIEEIKANFYKLLTEYPSGLRINSLLAAKYFSVKEDYIVVGNGAAEIINAYFRETSLTTGVILPTFEEYKNRLNPELVVCYRPDNPEFSYAAEDVMRFFTDHPVDQLILINPDNPSGNYIAKLELVALLNWAKINHVRLLLDESFVDFSDGGHHNSLMTNELLKEYPHLVVIKSISKSYGVPGLRLGVAATSNQDVIKEIKSKLAIWNINSFAEFYLQIFGKYEAEYHKACQAFREEREVFYANLQSVPYLRTFPSQANYFLAEVIMGNSVKLAERLLSQYHILVKDCSGKEGFKGRSYVRIAIRGKEDNEQLIRALEQIPLDHIR